MFGFFKKPDPNDGRQAVLATGDVDALGRRMYFSAKGRFAVAVPAQWQLVESNNEMGLNFAPTSTAGERGLRRYFRVQVVDRNAGSLKAEFADAVIPSLKRTMLKHDPSAQLGDPDVIELDGRAARRMQHSLKFAAVDSMMVQAVCVNFGRVYIIEYLADASSFDEFAPAVYSAFESWRWLPEPPTTQRDELD